MLRNLKRNARRLTPMGVVIVLVFALLLLGNALLASSTEGFRRVYTAYVSGDFTIAPAERGAFTIFGSQALLVGDTQTPPTIIDAPELLTQLRHSSRIEGAAGLVSSRARVEAVSPSGAAAGGAENQLLLGVEFSDYFSVVPELQLRAGELPVPGEAAVLLQEDRYRSLNRATGMDSVLGTSVLLSTAVGGSFAIREARIAGVFRYPVVDSVLEQVVLVNADTARALNGYVYGASAELDISDADQALLDTEMEDLFGVADSGFEHPGVDAEGLSAGVLDSLFSEFELSADQSPTQHAQRAVEGAYNFILIRSSASPASIQAELNAEQYAVRNWRQSVGGTAQLVWVLQLMLNLALAFVTLGAVAVTANALVLSVLERSKEIGTLRAMGAGRRFVALLISGETAVFVMSAASGGLLLGLLGANVLNHIELELHNPLISLLFGGPVLQALLTPELLLWHLLGGVLITLLTVLYPLKRVLEISPLRAMAGDSFHA